MSAGGANQLFFRVRRRRQLPIAVNDALTVVTVVDGRPPAGNHHGFLKDMEAKVEKEW